MRHETSNDGMRKGLSSVYVREGRSGWSTPAQRQALQLEQERREAGDGTLLGDSNPDAMPKRAISNPIDKTKRAQTVRLLQPWSDGDFERVIPKVFAGARNHLQANRSVVFRFDVTA